MIRHSLSAQLATVTANIDRRSSDSPARAWREAARRFRLAAREPRVARLASSLVRATNN
ncbi:MAG: hypothetical protein WCQ77_14030 [Planctomycetota bacterium]